MPTHDAGWSDTLQQQFPNASLREIAERKAAQITLKKDAALARRSAKIKQRVQQQNAAYEKQQRQEQRCEKLAQRSSPPAAAAAAQQPQQPSADAASLNGPPASFVAATKIATQEIAERTLETAAKGDEEAPALLSKFGFATTENILPNNWLGLRAFYNIMFQPRGYAVPKHMELVLSALADDRILQLLIVIGPGSSKSTAISTVYPAFKLGQNPGHTILGCSAAENLMQGFQLAIMEWVEFSPQWKALFPLVRPDKDKGWSTERGMFVTGHRAGDPDASFFATGIRSKALTGKHAKLLICDDIHDNENSASAESCLTVRETYYRQLLGRADPEGARFIFAGRRWHEEDLYGHLKSTGEYVVMELPALREGNDQLYWDVTVPAGLKCCFTDASIDAKLDLGL